ncbi:MAG: hypothetical protein R3C99_03365 [Pirellulaceae bacterium]
MNCERLGPSYPNVATVFTAGIAGGVYYVASEFVDGCNLAELVHRHGAPISIGQAMACVYQRRGKLTAIHELGIVHRMLSLAISC